jgi:fructose PTS system EIIBC or EIIC component
MLDWQALPVTLFSGETGPLLVLSVIILTGLGGGWIARRLHIPHETGNLAAGILIGASLGGMAAGAPPRIWWNTGMALMPQAGIAIGLVLLLKGDPRLPDEMTRILGTLALAAITVNELIGPFFTWRALHRAGEIGKDRRRLIQFLQEEYIITRVQASDRWEALRKVTDFFIRTHHVPESKREALYESIRDRERRYTTAIGKGAAIPHGRIEKGAGIRGVMAILHHGVDFDAYDGEPVRLIMLVVTPKGFDNEHLEVMASLAQMLRHEGIRERLLAAMNPYDAWEVIESEDMRNFNYFLEQDGEENVTA